VMLPKCESRGDVLALEGLLSEAEERRGIPKGSLGIIPMVESAKGVESLEEIASASKRIVAIAFGAGDFLRSLGLSYFELSSDELELLYARSKIVIAARSRGLTPIDTPFFGPIIDKEGLLRECSLAKRLGFSAKLAVHPSHIPIINKVFTPSEREVEEALDIVKAYEEAVARGRGAAVYKGRMIDYLTYRHAKYVIDLVSKLKERQTTRLEYSIVDFLKPQVD